MLKSQTTVPASRSPKEQEFLKGSIVSKEQKTIPGTGIGLAIVRRVAELHGGKPSLEDGLDGKGITFKISFPATQKQRSENQDEADDEYSDN